MLKVPSGEDDLDKYRKWETLAYSCVFLLSLAGCKGEPAPFEAPLIEWTVLGHSPLACHSWSLSVKLRGPESQAENHLEQTGAPGFEVPSPRNLHMTLTRCPRGSGTYPLRGLSGALWPGPSSKRAAWVAGHSGQWSISYGES